MLVLGIESSCDETAAAVVRDGTEILSSVISSQIELHAPFGGVVPELASREHLRNIRPIVERALSDAKVEFGSIGAIAVTQGPGLVGPLLVGVCYAKALAASLSIPVVGVNHIEGHVYSVVFENPAVEYPVLALIVSGGHTNLFFIPEPGKYTVVSRTRDDAAGEAFDKVAKMLGLGYPGGPKIEALASQGGDPEAFRFKRPKISDRRPDLSFSGMKTAVSKYLREEGIKPFSGHGEPSQDIKDMAASFQAAVVDSLIGTTADIARVVHPKTLIVAGGVACNGELRRAAAAVASEMRVPVYFPSRHLSTDNAAMIAAAGHAHLLNGEVSDLTMTADITLRLQNYKNEDADLKERGVRYRL